MSFGIATRHLCMLIAVRRSEYNLPPLHEAARLGDVQKVRKLLEDGEYSVDTLDPSTGWSPLMLIWRSQPSALGAGYARLL